MSRRIIPILCALVVAVVPATALAQPMQDPSPAPKQTGVIYGDTKYDLQNQQDQAVAAYDAAISGDTKGNLPRAIAPAGTKPDNGVSNVDRVGSLTLAQLVVAGALAGHGRHPRLHPVGPGLPLALGAPAVALTSKTPSPISRTETTKVPPPRSKTRIVWSVSLSRP